MFSVMSHRCVLFIFLYGITFFPVTLHAQDNIVTPSRKKQNKLKLVVPCQGDDYVVKEWLVYKIYNLISEKSFRAKLVQVDFEDSLKQRKTETHYCILLEDEKKMAERSDAFVWKGKMLNMKNTNEIEFRKMAVFQYMIGNTDWGIPFLQN